MSSGGPTDPVNEAEACRAQMGRSFAMHILGQCIQSATKPSLQHPSTPCVRHLHVHGPSACCLSHSCLHMHRQSSLQPQAPAPDSHRWPDTHSCLQTEDAFYFLPSPYPEGKAVGAVKHTSAILEQSTRREVPLSEVCTDPWVKSINIHVDAGQQSQSCWPEHCLAPMSVMQGIPLQGMHSTWMALHAAIAAEAHTPLADGCHQC